MNRLEPRLGQRQVSIDVPSEVVALVDPVLFEQVLVNLLENALKHTPAESPVEIRASAGDGEVVIEIADRGPGVPPGSETRIFEKFVRGGDRSDGSGLGLAICRGIVQAHGGTITAANAPGGGAVFRVTLPLDGAPPSVSVDSESLGQAS
jgi:two-component system sensor histidine kinase KdpD